MGCLCSRDQIVLDYLNSPHATPTGIVDGKSIFGDRTPAPPLLKEVNFAVISDSDPDADIDDDEINNILEEDSDE